MNCKTLEPKFVCLREASQSLGVPLDWLKAEAKTGSIPCIKPSRRMLFNVEAVEAALLSRKLEAVSDKT